MVWDGKSEVIVHGRNWLILLGHSNVFTQTFHWGSYFY